MHKGRSIGTGVGIERDRERKQSEKRRGDGGGDRRTEAERRVRNAAIILGGAMCVGQTVWWHIHTCGHAHIHTRARVDEGSVLMIMQTVFI